MSKPEKIAKLQTLLARVVSRSTEPRKATPAAPVATRAPVVASAPIAASASVAASVPVAARAPFVAPAPPPPAPPPPPPPSAPDLDDEITVAAHVPMSAPPPSISAEADAVLEVDVVEVGSEAVIDISAEEMMAPEALGSRERLVAAEAIAADVTELAAAAELPAPSSEEEPPPEILADESDVEEAGDLADLEEAPLSSRRPVGPQPEEQLAELAFGAGEALPPRHTPPPESGRLPAAPAVEFDPDVTGVRDATPIAPVRAHEAMATVATLPPLRELTPEAIVAALPAGDGVADVVGQAQRFQPTTFVALLEASLAL